MPRPASDAYRGAWFALALLGVVWGVISGWSLATGVGVGATAALTGLVGIVGLMITLFVAGDAYHRNDERRPQALPKESPRASN